MSDTDHTMMVQQLFVRYHNAILAFVLSLAPDFALAEDVVQETFLTVTRKASDFQPGSNFLAWARAIARLQVLKAREQGGRRLFSSEVIDILAAAAPEDMFASSRIEALSKCLDRLPPRMQELMRLRYHSGRGPQEISRLLSRTLNSVNVALAKARIVLRACVERELRRQDAR